MNSSRNGRAGSSFAYSTREKTDTNVQEVLKLKYYFVTVIGKIASAENINSY